jgi:uncharacterized protein (TIGR02996 family)
MTDGWALLRGIEAEPADDTPRLAYADWLEENGNAPRAEFIRLQVRRGEAGDRSEREWELQSAHQKSWVGELGCQVYNPRFRRGFLNPVATDLFGLVRFSERALAVAPLHHLRLYQLPGGIESAAVSPVLGHVRRLNATSNVIRNADVAILATSPHLVNLEHLNLESNHVGIAGCNALATANLPALRRLDLSKNPLRQRGLAALLRAPWAARLEWLVLASADLGPASPRHIAASPAAATLRRIDLNYANVDPARWTVDLVSAPLPALECLRISRLADDEVITRLAGNPTLGRLQELEAYSFRSDNVIRTILDSPYLTGLRRLKVSWPDDPALRGALMARFGPGMNPGWQAEDEWA